MTTATIDTNRYEVSFVNSTAILYVAYDADNLVLRIGFNSGAVYDYRDMMYDEYAALIGAESVGSTFMRVRNTEAYSNYTRLADDVARRFTFDAMRASQGQRVFVDSVAQIKSGDLFPQMC